MGFELKTWYSDKKQGEVLLEYNGSITSELITEALASIENSLNRGDKRVFTAGDSLSFFWRGIL